MVDVQRKINSLLIAMFILELQICEIITDIYSMDNISVIVVVLILVLFCVNNQKFVFNKLSVIAYIGICIFFLLSFLLNGYQYVGDSFIYFLFFGTVAFLISSTKNIDYISILRYAVYISGLRSIFYLLFEQNNLSRLARLIDNNLDWSYDLLQMHIAFEFMQIAIISIVVLVFRNEISNSKFFFVCLLLSLIISLKVILIDCWTRGALVGVAGTIVILLLWKRSRSGLEIMFFILCAFYLIANLESILIDFNTFLISKDINIRALTKSISLNSRGNVTNNRVALYLEAIDIFLESPIVGTGIGYFEKRTGTKYVHNIFLEIMCEMGIVGIGMIGTIILKNIRIIFDKKYSAMDICITVIFLMSFFCLLTSGTYWTTPVFWMFFFIMLQNYRKFNNV